MILVIPSIGLKDGSCLQCIIGEEGMESFYSRLSRTPLELCRLWRRENSKSIHIIDYDSCDLDDNITNTNAILYIAHSIDIPIQVYSHFHSVKDCRFLLEHGIYRIILNDIAVKDPQGISDLIKSYSTSRIIFQVTSKDGYLKLCKRKEKIETIDFLNFVKDIGGDRIIYENPDWDTFRTGPDIDELIKITEGSKLKITIGNGVENLNHLLSVASLRQLNIDSVIIGRALYHNNFSCQKIWRLIEAELEI